MMAQRSGCRTGGWWCPVSKTVVEGEFALLRPVSHRLALLVVLLSPLLHAQVETVAKVRTVDQPGFTESIRGHGFTIDDQYDLQVLHINDVCTIRLEKRDRAPGGPFVWFDPDTGEDESIIRDKEPIDLMAIRAEVLVPAPPNYLKNPGQRYRITLTGITVAPEFNKVFEVNAGDALAAVFSEIDKLYNSTREPIYRTGLFYGAVIALRVLNQTAHLPAEIPIGTMKSRSAQVRIDSEFLTRRPQPRLERFPKKNGAQTFSSTLGAELTGSLEPEKRSATRSTPTAMTAAPVQSRRFEKHEYEPENHRMTQLETIGDQKSAKNPLGRPGRASNVPEQEYPAISAAQIDSMNLLVGDVQSPLEQRMSTQLPQRPVAGAQRTPRSR